MHMFYIQNAICISPQDTFKESVPAVLHDAVDSQLLVIEPSYAGVNPGVLRRFGKAARIGIGAAMPLLQHDSRPDGMIIGTANGGMEESIRFLKQIVEYDEDMLAPGSFVQSTANAIAAQMGMITKNNGYNITHVHKAHAFENAVIDTAMLLSENRDNTYLLGGVDEIGTYNYNIEFSSGWYKKEKVSAAELYTSDTPGSIAGEGAAMFLVSNKKQNALAELKAMTVFHSGNTTYIQEQLKHFIETRLPAGEKIDLFITGENGDSRYKEIFMGCESLLEKNVTIARYKHMCGEYPTASAFALWLACHLPASAPYQHMIKRQGVQGRIKNILIYNFYQGVQHSFMLISK